MSAAGPPAAAALEQLMALLRLRNSTVCIVFIHIVIKSCKYVMPMHGNIERHSVIESDFIVKVILDYALLLICMLCSKQKFICILQDIKS